MNITMHQIWGEFPKRLKLEYIKEDCDILVKHKSKFMETKVIFKEAGFMSDPSKINSIQNLKQFKIEDVKNL